ncbi:uncharacterized protein [Littorina saxatilis]|uniref:Uncharacterized protein n=1 Tax=Littorina saxatilis TaxID=31220 RepID=A0AAN9BND7_9CAEN
MAPPQVDLSKKQPLEDVQGWAEQVGDEKLPSPPTSVKVEPATKLKRRRCKIIIIGFVIGAIVASAITAAPFLIHRHHHHWRSHVESDGHHAEEDVRTEGAKRVIYVARNETNHFFRLLAVLDYGTQMAGFKDCGRQRCYVDRLRESYEDGCERWRHYRNHNRLPKEHPLRVVTPPIDPAVFSYLAGENIASVCHGVPAYWVLDVPPDAPRGNDTEIIYL